MDTVEWGSSEPAKRRLPGSLSAPRIGGLVLAAIGFVLLVTAELNPWAHAVTVGGSGPSASPLPAGLELAGPGPAITYHLGALVLLGAVGLVLASPARWRRLPLGLAGGVAAGQLLIVVQVVRTLQRSVEANSARPPDADTVVAVVHVSYSSGVYLAVAGVLALAAASALTALRWRDLAATAPILVGAPPEPDADRELTVTALEPSDAGHYARE